uniref:Uncharacterized protein n=1 Tax=Anguilla anguilla TaxID=7936 RepID=A0A0E9UDC8_ANGAN
MFENVKTLPSTFETCTLMHMQFILFILSVFLGCYF